MKKISKKVCIVIPAYNEEKAITETISQTIEVFSNSGCDFSLVVVDDGSTDETAAVAGKFDDIKIIRHILNTGAGGATATGLSYAEQNGYEIAATMDADGQHDPKDVLKGIEIINNREIDLLIGSRIIDSKGMSWLKTVGNRGLSIITYLLFGINSTDSQSGLRIYSQNALRSLRWRTSGYEFCSEMLWRAKQIGLKIDEYPIQAIYTEYSMGKGQNNWNGFNIVKSLIRRRLSELFS